MISGTSSIKKDQAFGLPAYKSISRQFLPICPLSYKEWIKHRVCSFGCLTDGLISGNKQRIITKIKSPALVLFPTGGVMKNNSGNSDLEN